MPSRGNLTGWRKGWTGRNLMKFNKDNAKSCKPQAPVDTRSWPAGRQLFRKGPGGTS